MTVIESIILGAVQGLTEFLPVSSSGHLQIAKALLGVEIEENLVFDVTLHAATVLSTIFILWPEVKRLITGLFSRKFNEEQAYVLKIILSMIPIGIVGFAFKDYLNAMLESPYILTIVGCMLLLTAALLSFAYYARPRQKEQISYRDAFIIGLAQKTNKINILTIYVTLIITLILGRIVWGLSNFTLTLIDHTFSFSFKLFLAGAFINAYPGIILQLILIPPFIVLFHKLNMIKK